MTRAMEKTEEAKHSKKRILISKYLSNSRAIHKFFLEFPKNDICSISIFLALNKII